MPENDTYILIIHAPYYFITGSMTPGEEWASNEEQRKFYISYGEENPNPNMFNTDSMFLEGTFLLDLVQIHSILMKLGYKNRKELIYNILTKNSMK